MKANFKMGNYTVVTPRGDITLPEIEVAVEYSASEAYAMYNLYKEILGDMPNLIKEFMVVYESIEAANKQMEREPRKSNISNKKRNTEATKEAVSTVEKA